MKLIVFLTCLPALFARDTRTPTVTWPDAYTAIGRIILPYADIVEPFNVSVDTKVSKAMYSFYNGMAKMFYRGDEGKFGNMYKVVYVTMNSTLNKQTCFKLPGVEEEPVVVQSILPNITNFKYTEESVINGQNVSIFISHFVENTKTNTYTLAVRSIDKTPYMFYFVGYDNLLGSHFDEYVIYYDEFVSKAPPTSVFEISKESECGGFPGPGDTEHKKDNLFHELIGSATDHIESSFANFKQIYSRKYVSVKEHALRRKQFHQNFRFIQSKNRQSLTYKLAMNHLADRSEDEMKKMRGYRNTGFNSKFLYKPSLGALPSDVNWWIKGAVTPVKDQGICGSCWSFGTTGTLEGSLFIKTKNLVSLSEQAFVDCSWGQGNNGCDGGESERAYEWMLKNGCIPTEVSYGQYLMQDGMCHTSNAVCGANITKYYNTKSGDVNDLRAAIAEKGPISVAIDASLRSFSFYANGVYYDKKCGNRPNDLDHQVLAVGYGSQDGMTYWLVKNSWSTHWGMDGYVLMSDKENNCGVATDASFATIA